ncbi:isopentenyl-diphosphate Delta-isomerase [Nocardia sp. NPDC057227]|uniref:isopentenyl-diphosphate Delta-isomerase n=1 Tax=Nocardia sp. NPDC057227 TaxID=3346056 RepID=UPI00362C5A84
MTDIAQQPATDREALPVELVDETGHAVGACPVLEAHRQPGRLHRAFSVVLFDSDGRVLLQRRAAVKTRFPLLWANACCGHPAPGEPVVAAATVRLIEELGLTTGLTERGVYSYRADDERTGRVEHEWDHVLTGTLAHEVPRPDPAEVAEVRWVAPGELRAELRTRPGDFTPWLTGVLDVALG